MNNLKFIGIAIAAFMAFVVIAIGWRVIVPGDKQVLTAKYDLETGNRTQAYFGYHSPFLLSRTTVLWCNGSIVTFPASGTVVTRNASLDRNDIDVVVCR